MQNAKRTAAGVVTVLLLLATSQVVAQDWPQWRGPTRDGIAPSGPKLADTWPEGGPKLLWRAEGIPSGPDGGVRSTP